MTEGSRIPDDWVRAIEESEVEHILVPCEHNVEAFRASGVTVPISVVPGGTDPAEFPLIDWGPEGAPERSRPVGSRPYTFLTLADRGQRKGWMEVFDAFYRAFGGKTTGVQDVRLIIKVRACSGSLAEDICRRGVDLDKRIIWLAEDVSDMATLYQQADCLVLPSRSEGWGMPHREGSYAGLPVIVQKYADLMMGIPMNGLSS